MKKIMSLILALTMLFSLCISVSAAESTDITTVAGSKDMPVKIQVTEGISGTVYNVTVAWESMDFTYKKAATGTWDPDTHTYSNGNAAGWVIDGNQLIAETDDAGNYTAVSSGITVTNHSNASVSVSATLKDGNTEANHNGVALALSYDAEDLILNDASQVAYADVSGADRVVYTLKVSGVPDNSYGSTLAEVNTITITISNS